MESEVIETPSEVKKVDRFGFYEEDTGRSELFLRASIVEPAFDVKLENQRLHKWLFMLKNWEKLALPIFCERVDSARRAPTF